jgi:hypothetical protein
LNGRHYEALNLRKEPLFAGLSTSFYRRSRRDTTVNAIYEILTAKLPSVLPSKLRAAYGKLVTIKAPEAFRSQLLTAENPRHSRCGISDQPKSTTH